MLDGQFALWVPGAIGEDDVELVALDAAGTELVRQTLSKGGEQPEIVTLTPNPADPDASAAPPPTRRSSTGEGAGREVGSLGWPTVPGERPPL